MPVPTRIDLPCTDRADLHLQPGASRQCAGRTNMTTLNEESPSSLTNAPIALTGSGCGLVHRCGTACCPRAGAAQGGKGEESSDYFQITRVSFKKMASQANGGYRHPEERYRHPSPASSLADLGLAARGCTAGQVQPAKSPVGRAAPRAGSDLHEHRHQWRRNIMPQRHVTHRTLAGKPH